MISGSKTITTSGTEVQLVASTVENLARYCAQLTITGKTANTNKIYGASSAGVSTTAFGFSLEADQSYTIGPFEENAIDLANIWLDADTNGEGVTYVGEQV